MGLTFILSFLPAVAIRLLVINHGVLLMYSCRGCLLRRTFRMLPTLFQERRYQNVYSLVVSNFKQGQTMIYIK